MSKQLIINIATSVESAREWVLQTFQESDQTDAIFCMSDEILIGVIKAIQRTDLPIPDEVGVISISNRFFPKLYHPEITYVETSGQKLGFLAFTRMMNYFNGDTTEQELTIESVLVKGGSL